jgi:hypothetical protein
LRHAGVPWFSVGVGGGGLANARTFFRSGEHDKGSTSHRCVARCRRTSLSCPLSRISSVIASMWTGCPLCWPCRAPWTRGCPGHCGRPASRRRNNPRFAMPSLETEGLPRTTAFSLRSINRLQQPRCRLLHETGTFSEPGRATVLRHGRRSGDGPEGGSAGGQDLHWALWGISINSSRVLTELVARAVCSQPM